MSIWGAKPKENDDATDWLLEFIESPSLDLLEKALSEVTDSAHVEYVEIPEGSIAVVAAEILGQILGAIAEDPTLKPDETLSLLELVEDLEPPTVVRLVDQGCRKNRGHRPLGCFFDTGIPVFQCGSEFIIERFSSRLQQ